MHYQHLCEVEPATSQHDAELSESDEGVIGVRVVWSYQHRGAVPFGHTLEQPRQLLRGQQGWVATP